MKWLEKFKELDWDPLLITTATTGLDREKGAELIALAWLDTAGLAASTTLAHAPVSVMFCMVPAEKLSEAYQYHGITAEQMMQAAYGKSVFEQRLRETFKDHTLLVYNAQFQKSFLDADPDMLDIGCLYALEQSKIPLQNSAASTLKGLLREVQDNVRKPITFSRLCAEFPSSELPPYELPCVSACRKLYWAYRKLGEMEYRSW